MDPISPPGRFKDLNFVEYGRMALRRYQHYTVDAAEPKVALLADISGRRRHIGIHRERIRVLDIDAPESRQTCTAADRIEWRCGQKAALALSDWVGAHTVTCETTKLDRYGRRLARCTVSSQDMATWLFDLIVKAERDWFVVEIRATLSWLPRTRHDGRRWPRRRQIETILAS